MDTIEHVICQIIDIYNGDTDKLKKELKLLSQFLKDNENETIESLIEWFKFTA